MTHDDLVAVLLLLGVGPVDVVAEGSLNASPVLVILLEYGTEVETRPDPRCRDITEQARGARNEEGFRSQMSSRRVGLTLEMLPKSSLWQRNDALAGHSC